MAIDKSYADNLMDAIINVEHIHKEDEGNNNETD